MGAIDVGIAATDRGTRTVAGTTYIAYSNPANDTGVVTEVQIFVDTECSAVEAASFADEGGGVFSTNDTESIAGTYAAGYHELVSDLDFNSGEYIGFHDSGGKIEADWSGEPRYYKSGDHIPAASVEFTLSATASISLYGIGATVAAGVGIPIAMHHYKQMQGNN